MKRTLALLFTFLLPVLVQAQIEFGERYEQKHTWQNESYLVVSNEEEGLLLLETDFDAASKDYPVYLKQFDTELNVGWQDTLRIPQRFFIKGYHYSEKKTFLLLQNRILSSIKVLRIDAAKGQVDEFESKKIVELDITEFEVVKNTAVIGGYFEERPAVFAYDLENDIVRTLQNVYQNRSELLEIKVNRDSVTFNVLASTLTDNGDRTIVVNTYDYGGTAVRDYRLDIRPEYQLINGISSSINDITQVVVGLYSVRATNSVAGIYVNYIDRTGQQSMTYHNLGTLPHFFDYMGEKRSKKLKDKALDFIAEGKEQRYRAEVLFREVLEKDGKLIITAEYHKQLNNTPSTTRLMNYNRYNSVNNLYSLYNSYSQFYDGNVMVRETEFTHAYIMVLDMNGNLEWDDAMEIDETIEGGLDELGRFQWLGDDKAAYFYYRDEELYMKLLTPKAEAEVSESELKLMDEVDKIRHEQDATIGTVRWYDNHFIVYGVQHVRPEDKSEGLRKVFFINKISANENIEPQKLEKSRKHRR